VADDPYLLLGVERDASETDLKWAYERRISEAARLDAFKLMADIDRAYTVLRDTRRRALYDRHGVQPLPRREHPMQRWSPPPAVPFRSWEPPAQLVKPSTARRRQPCVRGALIGLSISAALALVPFVSHHLRSAVDNSPPASSNQIRVVCTSGPGVPGYSYVTTSGSSVGCSNGATPEVEADR
jgi:hypothetical protein